MIYERNAASGQRLRVLWNDRRGLIVGVAAAVIAVGSFGGGMLLSGGGSRPASFMDAVGAAPVLSEPTPTTAPSKAPSRSTVAAPQQGHTAGAAAPSPRVTVKPKPVATVAPVPAATTPAPVVTQPPAPVQPPVAVVAPVPAPTTVAPAPVLQHTIGGTFTVGEINAALMPQVGGYPGEPLSDMSIGQLNQLRSMLDSLEQGQTYACPGGAGGGYDDIEAGSQVVITDGNGNVLATTSLQGGVVNTHGCMFTFSVTVPDANFYGVTVTHRGTLTYSQQDLVDSGWQVHASVG
jgi:hypothetical protein